MPTTRVGDIDVYFEEQGPADGPPLLLISGIPGVVDDWGGFARSLARSRRVIAHDNRGGGGTTTTAGPYTTRRLADDAAGLLDALGVERTDVLGVSMGGMIAQELALGHPDRVGRLVLGCTHAGVGHASPQPRESARAFAMQTDDWAERMRALSPYAFAPGVDAAYLERFIEKKSRDVQDPEGYRGQVQAVLAHDTFDRLPGLACPTLVITGSDDQIIPAPSSDPLVARIPDARLEVIDGAGHLFFLERPETTLVSVEEFLGG